MFFCHLFHYLFFLLSMIPFHDKIEHFIHFLIVLITMLIPQPTITILQETATPVIQDGDRKAILLTITGKPTAKPCHSLVIKKSLHQPGQSALYHNNPSSSVENNIKTIVSTALQKNNNNQPFLVPGKPVLFFATFQFQCPNAHFINCVCSCPIHEIYCSAIVGTANTDNLCKLIMDALSKVIYVDDITVIHTPCYKMWHEDPTSDGSTMILVSN